MNNLKSITVFSCKLIKITLKNNIGQRLVRFIRRADP